MIFVHHKMFAGMQNNVFQEFIEIQMHFRKMHWRKLTKRKIAHK